MSDDPAKVLEAGEPRMSESAHRLLLVAVLAINGALILYSGRVTLRDFQNSGDEYASWVSAALFAQGRMSAPPWEPRESFALYHTLNDDKFYGKYPPGWPFLLSLGMRAGVPFLVNPLLGLLTLALVYRIGREHFSAGSGSLALAMTLANPFIVLNSASYHSHPSCLLALTACAAFVIRSQARPDGRLSYALAGACAGVAFLIRPYTALAVSLPLAGFALKVMHDSLGRTTFWTRLGCAILPFAVCVALLLAYNAAQTGDPLLQPFSKYDPADSLGRTSRSEDWSWALEHNLLERALEWSEWIPLAVLFICLPLLLAETRRSSKVRMLAAASAGLYAAYLVYLRNPGNQYGPRYLYEVSFAAFLLGGIGLSRLGASRAFLVLGGVVLVNAALLVTQSIHFGAQVRERMTLYDRVKEADLRNAIVLVRTGSGSMHPKDLTRNGIDSNPPVLYALDRGVDNRELFERYPHRRVYAFEYDSAGRSGRLVAEDRRD